ncbi:monoamine oxidase [Neorhizobium galegae]|uniref:flavin monoamine oxidase family protein n=1 Tax=Neorhizobium galegae TaxID=399 RepID=UPI001FDAA9FC|nr:FAD-dependent oxidoreductase [Neorhizobium galegae]MBP2551520.1 monoamine oxidase [Neorhizobium galegae]
MRSSWTRRTLLRSMTALAGSLFAPPLLSGLGQAQAAYRTTRPDLPADFGRGRSVAIVGAGVAGLTSALRLANAGFKVVVFEADSRYGGRSLTARPSNEAYRKWWFKKYPGTDQFPAMYADRYQEVATSPAPDLQICEFMDDDWKPESGRDPVELFLNAGPGRIPSNHVNLIALCQEIGVALEPYFFQSMSNLIQSQTFDNGKPISFAQVTYSLYAEMAQMMYQVAREGIKLKGNPGAEETKALENLYQLFGNLSSSGDIQPNSRLGYTHLPGGWRDSGTLRDSVPLDKILSSGFIGDADANPELSPGSFLFNGFNIDWQPSLMQPIGGMDRIWQQLLLQDVPKTAIWNESLQPVAGAGAKVGNLVLLNTAVTGIAPSSSGVSLRVNPSNATGETGVQQHEFDFCISTTAPSLLNRILVKEGLPRAFINGLDAFSVQGEWGDDDPTPNLWTPAIKVGWQGKSRFWETEDEIYGGISWTTDIIGQIWYPSEDFTAHTGILTGAYNRGTPAVTYARQGNVERIATARHGLGLLHPEAKEEVYRGLSIAWQYMPNQVGGWASDTASTSPNVYREITTFDPSGRFFCAGDTWSYWPGWQEGAVASAYCAIAAIAHSIEPLNCLDCGCFSGMKG